MSGAADADRVDPVLVLDPAIVDVPEDRLRAVDPDRVAEMAESWRVNGQLQPGVVRPAISAGRYILVIGAHRHAAAVAVGGEFRATLTNGNPDDMRLLEIDENLYRHELTPYDRAAFLAERRLIFERRHGAVKPGRRGKGISDKLSQLSFFDDVTGKFGLPKRMIQRSLKLKHAIPADIWAQLRGHPVTKKESELDKLARLDEVAQRRVVRMLRQAEHPAKDVSAALRALADAPAESADERQFRRLVDVWSKAGKKAREDFRAYLDRQGHQETGGGRTG